MQFLSMDLPSVSPTRGSWFPFEWVHSLRDQWETSVSSITSSHESHTVTSAKLYQSDRAALISGERTEHRTWIPGWRWATQGRLRESESVSRSSSKPWLKCLLGWFSNTLRDWAVIKYLLITSLLFSAQLIRIGFSGLQLKTIWYILRRQKHIYTWLSWKAT